MSDKFLKLIEENTPGNEDRTPEEQAKVQVTSILKNAGYEADYKTFKDEITVALGDGTKVVLEVKNVISAEAEEVDGHEDQEMAATDAKKMTDMANTAAKIMAIKSPSLKDQMLNPASRKIQMAKRTLADKIHKAAKKFEI